MTNVNRKSYRLTNDGNVHELAGYGNSARSAALDGAGFWEGMLAQCIMFSSHQFLSNVCADEDVTLGEKDALGVMMHEPDGYIETSKGSDSSTDSSSDPVEHAYDLFKSGIIRLRRNNMWRLQWQTWLWPLLSPNQRERHVP